MTELYVNLNPGESASSAWAALFKSFGNNFSPAPPDPLHPGFENSYRQNKPQWSMQISFNSNQSELEIDIDPWNPMGGAGAFAGHAGDVMNHWLTGNDTNYGAAASALGLPVQNCAP
jgi:hypothetical protein